VVVGSLLLGRQHGAALLPQRTAGRQAEARAGERECGVEASTGGQAGHGACAAGGSCRRSPGAALPACKPAAHMSMVSKPSAQ
jgi:hypothetical protein